ncbi:orotate phosphoribosyltransferase [Patescibacteria group bacterium]|nr:orotate phosphoribosyltransferase [Patescibacteria group bacterium]
MYDAKPTAEALLDAGAFKISLDPLFTWTSGIKSPVYCDLRALISVVKVRESIVDGFVEMIKVDGLPEVIAGTATAGIPWAAWVADRLQLPLVYIRGEAKEHGTKKRVEGMMPQGVKVVLIEDHISTGKSSVSALLALREEERAIVDRVYAINTYELMKAAQAFDEIDVKFDTITNYSTILKVAHERGVIDESQVDLLTDFRADPAGWAERHSL